MKYSIIIPVYNRPDEVQELLESLTHQRYTDFEVIIVEDGSSKPCDSVVRQFADKLQIQYLSKSNGGPSAARNYGAAQAQGQYFIVLDSDCVVPEGYLAEVDRELSKQPCDAWGGPDKADSGFTPIQKAISYSMTSFLTTGGIRGGKQKLDKFYPRSFNMGLKAEVYRQLGGFSNMRFGEDIDLSLRIFEQGYSCRLFPEAWVWHKRRTDFRKFFRQVINSGIARINLEMRHPGSLKLVHALPACFTIGVPLLIILAIVWSPWWLAPLGLYILLLVIGATMRERSLHVGLLAVLAAFVQLGGYGMGFLWAWWRRYVLHQQEFGAFSKTFYK